MAKTARAALIEQRATQAGELINAVDLREFARLSRAVAHFAIALSLPWQTQLLIHTLIVASDGDGDTEIEMADYTLAFWMRSEQHIGTVGKLEFRTQDKPRTPVRGAKVSDRALTSWVARVRKTLIQRQKDIGITLIEVWPGGMKKGERFPTKYRLPILFFLRDVQEVLRTDARLEAEPELAIREAVMTVLRQEQKLLAARPVMERFKRPHFNGDVYLKLAQTYFLKAVKEYERTSDNLFPVYQQMWRFVETHYEISKKAGKAK